MYKVEAYKNSISSMDQDTQKRFDMVKRLSRNFTTENPTARTMDELLAEQIGLESKSSQTAIVPVKKPAIPKKRDNKVVSLDDELEQIKNGLLELFENLSKGRTASAGVNPQEVSLLLDQALKSKKIGFDHLEQSLQEKLSKQQIIKYSLPPAITPAIPKSHIADFQRIIDDVVLGQNVMLVGGAGTGKTFLAQLVAEAIGREYLTINCSQWTAPTEIIGGQTLDGYQEGKLIEAWKHGYVLILDELPKIDPNTAGLLNDALAKTKAGGVIFNSRKESFSKHPGFACIATGNIYPNSESIAYGANNKQDLSLLDRFSGSVYFIEKNMALEKMIVGNNMIWEICDSIRAAIEEMKYEAQLSLRFMQTARDSYNLEIERLKSNGKDGVKADEGKTLKSTLDSFLSTFTPVQQKNIKDKIGYDYFIQTYRSRV